eukprot:1729482-Prorocentrum_lima.AAC.1
MGASQSAFAIQKAVLTAFSHVVLVSLPSPTMRRQWNNSLIRSIGAPYKWFEPLCHNAKTVFRLPFEFQDLD